MMRGLLLARVGRSGSILAVAALALLLPALPGAAAEQKEPPQSPAPRVILDTGSYWRTHVTLRPHVYGTAAAPKRARGTRTRPADQPHTEFPPEDWMQPEFDDASWRRDPGSFGGSHPALICGRGKFTVSDPSRATDLKLSVSYHGGIVVYLNGEPVVRAHLPDGKIGFDTPAGDYPKEAYTGRPRTRDKAIQKKYAEDMAKVRVRRVELRLPPERLRKGMNVLALEIHRSVRPSERSPWTPLARLGSVTLASASEAVTSNAQRPKGVQVWSVNPLVEIFETSYGDPHDPIRPIRIVGARNGVFSGVVVLSSERPIKGPKAKAGALKRRGGEDTIPAEAVRVRYAASGGPVRLAWPDSRLRYPLAIRFDVLRDVAPAEVTVREKTPKLPSGLGAVLPVWVTVRVPKDAAPGEYEGTVTLQADGMDPVTVPVLLNVCPFALPDPADFRTWVGLIQSPDTLAKHYRVALWSDRHWKLIGRSFDFMAALGNRTLYIPAFCGATHLGNAESMIRWVKDKTGTLVLDFSIVERYVDLALGRGMKPRTICLYVYSLDQGGSFPITVVDAATGRVERGQSPAYEAPQAEPFWRKVADGFVAVLKKRRLDPYLNVGWGEPGRRTKDAAIDLWAKLLPTVPRFFHDHHTPRYDPTRYPNRYVVTIWDNGVLSDPAIRRSYGWKNPRVMAWMNRGVGYHIANHRLLPEWCVEGHTRGIGGYGADFWPMRGRSWYNAYLCRGGNIGVHPSNILASGPDGALATARYEMIRESVQECEAKIFIESTLTDPAVRARVGEELAKRCEAILWERIRYNLWTGKGGGQHRLRWSDVSMGYEWYAQSGWQERSEKLFDAAASVQEKLGEAGAGQPERGDEE